MQPEKKPENGHLRLKISGMDCGDCARTIEKSLKNLPGIKALRVNFTTESLEAEGSVSEHALIARLKEMGYDVVDEAAAAPSDLNMRGALGFLRFLLRDWHGTAAALAALLLVATAPAVLMTPPLWPEAMQVLYVALTVIVGTPIVLKGGRALVFARRVTIDVLMGVAVMGALLIGATGEAAVVVTLFTIGEALEGYAADQSRRSLKQLLSLQPEQATVLRPHADSDHAGSDQSNGSAPGEASAPHLHRVVVPVEEVAVGETVFVRPGERIPVDGTVLSGASSIDQAAITGESVPVRRGPGDPVFAGTINGEAALEIRVDQPAGESTISRVARLVEQAQAQRSPAERFIDRFARWYTPAVVVLAVLSVAIATLVFGQPFFDTPEGPHGWLYRGLALLIIACPCALVISVPVTVVSALTRLAQLGVLVKGGAQLTALNDLTTFAFDKTGTLTIGRPQIATARASGCEDREACSGCESCDDMIALAASVESGSEHPLARAVLAKAENENLDHRYKPARAVTALAGRGVRGELDGDVVTIGSPKLFTQKNAPAGPIPAWVPQAGKDGHSVLIVARNDNILGYMTVSDEPRESSRLALRRLHQDRPDIRTVMLTGDNENVAREIGRRIPEIDEIRADLLPEEKLTAIRELQDERGGVAMVGDGINDAPALAAATIGIAMGGAGSAQAIETADIVLMRDDLSMLPVLVRAARLTRRLLHQNITLSLVIKLVFVFLAIPGLATMWMAVLADVGATLIVTLNGMRLLRLDNQGRMPLI